MPIRSLRSGQSLVELLISISLGSLFIVSVAATLAPALRQNTQATNVQVASALGKELLDNVRVWSEHDWHNMLSLATGSANTYYLNTANSPFQLVTAASATFPNGYAYRRTITIQGGQVSRINGTNLSNFPVLVSTVNAPLADMAAAPTGFVQSAAGNDIGFYADPSGTVPLYAEQEYYSSSTGALIYWVQVPALQPNVNTPIYMFYGNPSALSPGYFSQRVWDANYKSVYHFSTFGATTPDSTVNGNNATVSNGATQVWNGPLGESTDFVSSTHQFISAPLDLTGSQQATIELWHLEKVFTRANEWAVSFTPGTAGGFWMLPNSSNGTKFDVYARGDAGGNEFITPWSSPGTWHHYAMTVDMTAPSDVVNLYIDGVLQPGSWVSDQNYTSQLAAGTMYLMTFNGSSNFDNAIGDEVRVSSNVRSADWVNTEYNNESNPGSFYLVGSATTPSGVSTLSESIILNGVTYTRSFYALDVRRDANGMITSSGGTYDPSTKQVVVTYGWPTGSANVAAYFTRSRNTLFDQNDWSGGPGQDGPITAGNSQFYADNNITFASGTGAITLPLGSPGGYANGYSFRKTITVNPSLVSPVNQGGLADFPMLFGNQAFSYLAASSSGGAVQSSNGYDIIFTSDAAGNNTLNFEIEKYVPATGEIEAWVQVPTLSSTSNKVYLFYGNSNVTVSQANPLGTWDPNYQLVWHLPDGSSLSANDSTGHVNGTVSGASAVAGRVDGGAATDPSSYISFSDAGLPAGGGPFTFSGWFKSSTGNTNNIMIDYGNSSGVGHQAYLGYYDFGNGKVVGNCGFGGPTNVVGDTNLNDGVWHYLACSVDGGSTVNFYIDGVSVASQTFSINVITGNTGTVGRAEDGSQTYAGTSDEIRVSNVDRSADWIGTEYNNQSNPAGFYTVN